MCSIIRNTDNRVRKEGNKIFQETEYASGSEIRGKTEVISVKRSGHFLTSCRLSRKICIDNLR